MQRFVEVERLLRSKGVRLTTQRRLVVRRAITRLHFTAEQLVRDVQAIDRTVARGTVYRTLGLLHTTGVVEKHDFRCGAPNYEVTFAKAHHDHLMCVRCGEIIEFQEPSVEQIQERIVKRYGYELLSHTHKLYGRCRKCRQRETPRFARPPRLHVEEVVA